MTDRRLANQPEETTLDAAAQRARALAVRQALHAFALPAVVAQRAHELAVQQVLHACALTMRALAARVGASGRTGRA